MINLRQVLLAASMTGPLTRPSSGCVPGGFAVGLAVVIAAGILSFSAHSAIAAPQDQNADPNDQIQIIAQATNSNGNGNGTSGAEAKADAVADDLRDAQTKVDALRSERETLSETRSTLTQDLRSLRQKLIIAAQDAQEREGIVTNLEAQLAQLSKEQENRQADLWEERQQLTETLSALTRLSRYPPQNILFQPGDPIDTIRGSQLLRATVPTLQERAQIIAEQLAALNAVKLDIRDKIGELQTTQEDLDRSRTEIDQLISQKNNLLSSTDSAIQSNNTRLKDMVERATSLKDLMERLARAQVGSPEPGAAPTAPTPPGAGVSASETASSPESDPAVGGVQDTGRTSEEDVATAVLLNAPPVDLRPFPVTGQIQRPVSGQIVRKYGERTKYGQTSKGISIKTRPGARITAPFDGKVAYSGPFQTIGLILIIEHSDGYHSVLAGFSRVDVRLGQWVLAGEPVGVVGDEAVDSRGQLAQGGGATNSSNGNGSDLSGTELYVEVRRAGQPVNPLQWIPAERGSPARTKVKS